VLSPGKRRRRLGAAGRDGGTTVENRGPNYDFRAVEEFAGMNVRVRLDDGSEFTGQLRTELLSDRSLSVYIAGGGDEGATLYIDQIVAIVPFCARPAT
jgi:hypothetical protein